MPDASDIAIIGMAGRFPGARTPDELWANVAAGIESIARLTDAELRAAGIDEATLADPAYVKAAARLDDVAGFDAGFFGFSRRDAEILDPQHRHFLEVAWEALEDAGHLPERFEGSVGVFGGCGMGAYFAFNLLTNPELVKSVGLFLLRHTGNDKDFLTTRVSHLLDLRGPSVGVQTACSTSLVAVHLACQHLLAGECDMALAGAVTIELPHGVGYHYQEGEILSPDGHCRAFDAAAQGTVFGSGAGIVVLRRMEDALADGDRVLAVIKGSAVNNDGAGKVNYLAPSVDGQSAVVLEALSVAGLPADSIGYVETHGTGTPIGDPIEIAGLTEAFRAHTARTGYCAIGSLKPNVGHLDTAAGVAGLIRAVQALRHRQIPPLLHFRDANPALRLATTPFVAPSTLRDWPAGEGSPRRAGVSSLGVGGTNAHVILEEAPATDAAAAGRPRQLLVVSARSEAAAAAACRRLAAHLRARPDLPLADVAWTLQLGRRAFAHRRAVVAGTTEDAVTALEAAAAGPAPGRPAGDVAPRVVMLFPGGGAQYPAMGRGLYAAEPVYRAAVDECLALARTTGLEDVRPLLVPDDDADHAALTAALQRPATSILAVFVTEVALARLFVAWGVQPAALLGHSLGEYAAAHLAGVLSLADALAVVAKRGEIFARMPAGGMLSVGCGEARLASLLPAGVVVAAVNAPDAVVASGDRVALGHLEARLAAEGIEAQRVPIDVAAHSPLLEPFLDEFRAFLRTRRFAAPTVPVISNLTGRWAGAEMADPEYWVRHLRETVRFADGVRGVLDDPAHVLLEVGPGHALGALARAQAGEGRTIVAAMRHRRDAQDDLTAAYAALGQLWAAGLAVAWPALHGDERRRRVGLPTYPFEHERYWIDPGRGQHGAAAAPPALDTVAGWGQRIVWQPAPAPGAPRDARGPWLVLAPQAGRPGAALAEAVVARLGAAGIEAWVARPGTHVTHDGRRALTMRPGERADVDAVLATVRRVAAPRAVVHLWALDDASVEAGFATLLAVAQALGDADGCALEVVTAGASGAHAGGANPRPAMLAGMLRVIATECPGLACRAIDLPGDHAATDAAEAAAALLADELLREPSDVVVALAGGSRTVPTFAAAHLLDGEAPLRSDATYLVTGAFGGIGGALARYLAETYRCRLVLLSRAAPTPAGEALVRELQACGARVHVAVAAVQDEWALARALAAARAAVGPIHGVFHAAGVIDDGLIALKAPDAARAVLAPKVDGTTALDAVTAADPVEWFVLCGSTSRFLGLPGQVDYAAANAFLPAFARWRAATRPGRTLAIDWGPWREVGMAARLAGGADAKAPAAGTDDPWLGRLVERRADRAVWEASYAATRWVLDEHRLGDGTAVLPGTAYVALVDAAFRAVSTSRTLEVRDLVFAEPLLLAGHDAVTLRVSAERSGDQWEIAVASTTPGVPGVREHARASAGPAPTGPVEAGSLAELAARCPATDTGIQGGLNLRQARHLRFGPRWRVIREVRVGARDALAALSAPGDVTRDAADACAVHPALLDAALAAGLPLAAASGGGVYVPLSCGRLRVHAPLAGDLRVHARPSGATLDPDTPVFDVTVMDATGRVLADAREFTMRRVDRLAAPPAVPRNPDGLAARQAHAIAPADGIHALMRALATSTGPELIISSVPLATPTPSTRRPPRAVVAAPVVDGTETEREVVRAWSELLGAPTVGLDDDFFRSGGHSLVAVRLASRLNKAFGTHLKLAAVFDAPTVRQLARLVDEARAARGGEPRAGDAPAAEPPPIVAVSRDAFRRRRSELVDGGGGR